MAAGGLTGTGNGSSTTRTTPPSSRSSGSAFSVSSKSTRQAQADGKKPGGKPEQRPAGGGQANSVGEQNQRLQEFDAFKGRPPVGERRQGDASDQREGSFVGCAAGAAKDVVVDTVKGAYNTAKDAGGAALDQAGFEGYEGHTERTVDRGKAVWDGAKRTGEAVMSPIDTAGKIADAAKAEAAEIKSEIEQGDSCALGERVGMTVGTGATVVVPGGIVVKGGKVLAKMGGKNRADGPDSKPLPPDVVKRYDDLKNQGHGPQRHGADVTTQQLEDRVLMGHDPMTGSPTDGVTGGKHRKVPTATRIKSAEDFVTAEHNIRGSLDYRDARDAALVDDKSVFKVRVPLDRVLGQDYTDKIEGRTRLGPKGNPQGTMPTDLTDGKMFALYEFKPGAEPQLITMYPEPKR